MKPHDRIHLQAEDGRWREYWVGTIRESKLYKGAAFVEIVEPEGVK